MAKDGNDVLLTLFDGSCGRSHPAEFLFPCLRSLSEARPLLSLLKVSLQHFYHPLLLSQLLGLPAALTVQSENECRGAAENGLASLQGRRHSIRYSSIKR